MVADPWSLLADQASREAESNKAKLTKEYLTLELFKAATQNATLYFGDAIPTTLITGTGAGAPTQAAAVTNLP